MRILLVHNFYQQFGGEDQVVLQDLESLGRRHEVSLYSRHNDEVLDFNILQKARVAVATLGSKATEEKVAAVVAEFKPDVAYVHNIYPLISPSVYNALSSLKVPIVQVIHDFRPLCSNGWFFNETGICERCKGGNHFNAVLYKCYKNSYAYSALYAATMTRVRNSGTLDKVDAFICLTEFAREKLMSAGISGEKIFVRPNSIDVSGIQPRIGQGDYVAYLGRLSPEKGLWTLVRAFEHLDGPKLKIAGTGPLAEPLREYVAEKAIRNVEFVGFLTGEAKSEFVRNSMFTVAPSEWYEMFPLSLLEAWAFGKPTIGANVGAMPYLIRDGENGLLFNVADPVDLAAKIDSLYRSPSTVAAMGAKAREIVETEFDPEVNEERLIDIFRKAGAKELSIECEAIH